MKRAHETTNKANDPDGAGPSSSRAKRPKHIQACASCRRQKTRCEILPSGDNSTAHVKCHRCKVLSNDCSYSEMDRNLFAAFLTPPGSESISDAGTSGDRAAQGSGEQLDPIFPRPDYLRAFASPGTGQVVDWSAPMVAVHDLVKQPLPPIETWVMPVSPDHLIEDILTKDQIRDLLCIFDARYTPWLNFTLIRAREEPVLDLICCTVASRHLDPHSRSTVAPRLQKLTENTIVKMIFNPRSAETMESIQALLILSLWSSIYGSADGGIRDGRVLIASAVSMAMNLHLNEASAEVISSRDLPTSGKENATVAESDKKHRARLWITLTNIESMLCVGTGRMPLSRRSLADINLISHPHRAPSNALECRDLRPKFSAELFDATERGKAISLVSPAGLDPWYDQATLVLCDMDRLQRLSVPLSVASDHDQFYFHMSLITLHTCRLLTIYHFMYDARVAYKDCGEGDYWFLEVRPRGIHIMNIWEKETLGLSEAILVAFLQADKGLLTTVPDNIFHMIGFAAGFLVGVKFLVLKNLGRELWGSSDSLLSKTLKLLYEVSFSNDHAAKRCAHLVHGMITVWERRHRGSGDVDVSPPYNPPIPPTLDPLTPASDIADGHHAHEQTQPFTPHSLPVPDGLSAPQFHYNNSETDPTWFMNSSIFQDAEFWSQFFAAQDPHTMDGQ